MAAVWKLVFLRSVQATLGFSLAIVGSGTNERDHGPVCSQSCLVTQLLGYLMPSFLAFIPELSPLLVTRD